MLDTNRLQPAHDFIRKRWPAAHPRHGLILGSGWSEVVETFHVKDTLTYEEIPGMGATGVSGHAGRLLLAECAGRETLIFQGRRHWYEGDGWEPVALPVYVAKNLGVETLLLTNAAGGMDEDMVPGDLMMVTDHINMMGANPLLGPHDPRWGERFPDQTQVYSRAIRGAMIRAAQHCGLALREGVYLATSGPVYETPAEIRFYRACGASAVGMSTVPEAMLASAAGLRVGAVSCITNLASGMGAVGLDHGDVVDTSRRTMPRLRQFLTALWKEFSDD